MRPKKHTGNYSVIRESLAARPKTAAHTPGLEKKYMYLTEKTASACGN